MALPLYERRIELGFRYQRREDDPVLGIEGIDMAMDSRDVQKANGRAFH